MRNRCKPFCAESVKSKEKSHAVRLLLPAPQPNPALKRTRVVRRVSVAAFFRPRRLARAIGDIAAVPVDRGIVAVAVARRISIAWVVARSEERRVGKECRL